MTELSSDVYFQALLEWDKIHSHQRAGACIAICNARRDLGFQHYSYEETVKEFTQYFKPTIYDCDAYCLVENPAYWFEGYDERVLALCFMLAIAEDRENDT